MAGGTGPGGKTVWEHSLQEVEDIFAVNVYGPFLTMKHFLPVMIAARAGAVVNVGGTFGFKGAALSSAYGATKWALRGFTHSAALEAGPMVCASTASIPAAWTARACAGSWPRQRSARARPTGRSTTISPRAPRWGG